jgi:plastocyanin
MKRVAIFLAAAAVAVAGLGACGGGSGGGSGAGDGDGGVTGGPAPMTATVVVKDLAFKPSTVKVAKGGTVTWKFNDGTTPHNVAAKDGTWKSDNETSGTYDHTFDSPGRFKYTCTLHPAMKATVIVVTP